LACVAWLATLAESISRARASRPSADATCWATRVRPLGDEAELAQPTTRPAPVHQTMVRPRHSSSLIRADETSTLPCTWRDSTRSIGTSPIVSPALVTTTRPALMPALAPYVARWTTCVSGSRGLMRRLTGPSWRSSGRQTPMCEHLLHLG